MRAKEPEMLSLAQDPLKQMIAQKMDILHRIHAFCLEQDIPYFAIERLARAAETGEPMTPAEERAPWKIAMLRAPYRQFRQTAPAAGFFLEDTGHGCVEVRLDGVAGEPEAAISLLVFDALPASASAKRDFLAQVRQARQACSEAASEQAEQARARLDTLAQTYEQDPDAVMVAPLLADDVPQLNRALLYPVKNRRFGDILICVPADPSIWVLDEDREAVQNKLRVLRELDRFCTEAGLPYFAISKLEISSRMYGDLMPGFGCSAMEVGMIRADYDALRDKLAQAGAPFVVYDTDREGNPDGALHITLDTFVQGEAYPEDVVAVLPYDFLPTDEKERKEFTLQMKQQNVVYARALRWDAQHPGKPTKAPGVYQQNLTDATRYNGQQEGLRRIGRNHCGQSKTMLYHHVYPVVRSQMADFEINCPANPYLWAEASDVNFHNAAAARKTEILKRLTRLCNDHQLTAFAIADLLIGAVTYQDYVPGKPGANWDMALLRADYEKLLALLRTDAAAYGLSLEEYRDAAGRYPKATKTVDLQELTWPEGAIRLIPFDKMPEAYDTQYAFLRKLRRLNALFKDLTDQEILGKPTMSERELRRVHRQYGDDPLNALYQKIDRLSQTYNDDADTHLYGRMVCEKSKFIHEQDLFPLEKAPFRDMQLNRPRDYSIWTPVIDEALHTQVTSIQQADLLLIDKVDEICRKLDIGYFICGGSLLGYMRHGGFIPWDDDIDVAMLREDYDRFVREAEPFLDDRFFLQTRQKDPHIPYLFSKLRLNNTEYITKYNERRAFHKGICLDIFPFDYIPNSPKGQKKFREEVLRLSKAHNRIVNNQMAEPIDPIKPRTLREHYYHWYGMLKRFYFHCQSLEKSQKAYLDKATSLNATAEEEGLTTVASFVPTYTFIQLDDLLPYQDALFEGHRVKVPHRPDVFLTMQYGDYLQLPPKHNQVAHRLLRWSVDVKADEAKRQAAAAENPSEEKGDDR